MSKENESNILRLEEMLESMDASLKNILEISGQQEKLIELVEKHGKVDFMAFIKESREQLENLKKQYASLGQKRVDLDKIINIAKSDKEKEDYLNLILNTLINF